MLTKIPNVQWEDQTPKIEYKPEVFIINRLYLSELAILFAYVFVLHGGVLKRHELILIRQVCLANSS